MNKEKITYQQLSTPLKIAIISAYIYLTIASLAFLIGIITGLTT